MTRTPKESSQETANPIARLAENWQKISVQSQKLLQMYFTQQGMNTPAQDSWHIQTAFLKLFDRWINNPQKLWDMQLRYWQDYFRLWNEMAKSMAGEKSEPVVEADPKDRRFKDQAWHENAVFDFLKQSYLLTAQHIHHAVTDVEGLDEHTRRKIEFYTRQYIDAISPSNFLYTNPEALRTTLETHGENLVQGLENVLEDLKKGKGRLRISMTDESAFKVGENLATTKGSVVYQNDLMQLIQYEAVTDTVHPVPLLIIPAWINKFYILDLQKENSLVRWLTEQGYTVFIISWVNPDETLAKKTFEDYLNEGPLAALDVIASITGQEKVSTLGYCLGGTLLSAMLAYLHKTGDAKRIASSTFFTTLLDFKEAGDLSVFIDEDQLQSLEQQMEQHGGILEGYTMANTFNMLRANDLIWSFVVNNYLLGKDPFPFDLLYWNADSTRMPMAMHLFYLRKMYQQNKLVKPDAIKLNGKGIDLRAIKTPSYFISTREDHIAPWQSTYKAVDLFSGTVEFVLAASGHIAGIINPPSKGKYGFWAVDNGKLPAKAEDFQKMASEHKGSWWPHWDTWQHQFQGEKVKARAVGNKTHPALEPAPGSYVFVDAR